VVKRKKYASAGIQYYWIIDATAQTLCEYRLEGADYVVRAEVHGAGEFRPELFPRLVIPLPRLWGSPLPE
jgi:Uma2 family endonuclease